MTCFIYAATTTFDFAYDDLPQIVDNPQVHSAAFLPKYFSSHVWSQSPGQSANFYRPLFMTWLLANFEVFELQPAGWHVTSVLLHLLATWLVYWLARKMVRDNGIAALTAAAIFAFHPSHVESVAWISGVTESLATAFFVGSFLAYLQYKEQGKVRWISVSLGLCLGAVLCKETAVVLPLVILLYELLLAPAAAGPGKSVGRIASTAARLAPFVVIVAIYLVVRTIVLHGFAHRMEHVSTAQAIFTLPWVVYFYLSQILVPVQLGLVYDVDYVTGPSLTLLVIPLVVLLAAAFGVWQWAKRSKSNLPIFLAAWFAVTLAPSLAVFLLMSRYENIHDRYLYLPSVAFALLAGFAVSSACGRAGSRRAQLWLGSGAVVVLAGMAVMTYDQALYWQNSLTVFQRAANVAPRNVLAKLNLSAELLRRQMVPAALQVAQKAVELDPKSPLALNAAGQASYFLGSYPQAELYYSQALKLGPPDVGQLYYLGLAKVKQGRYQEGLEVLQKGLALFPNSPGFHTGMGRAYEGMGQRSAAREQYNLELALFPTSPGAREALANLDR